MSNKLRICLQCKKNPIKGRAKKYCSTSCAAKNRALKGKVHLHLGKYSQINAIPWNKGKKGLQVAWNKGLKGFMAGEKHSRWKGNNVGYDALHDWVRRNLGSPTLCEKCGTNGLSGKKIHWANKSGKYKRNLEDWIRLCVRCHKEYDNQYGKNWSNILRRKTNF